MTLDEIKKTLRRCATLAQAAAEIGCTVPALKCKFQRLGERPGDYLKRPAHARIVPKGHRIKGNSTLLDGDGGVERRWVKTERDSDDPSDVAAVPEGHHIQKVSTQVDGQGKVRSQWIQAPKAEVVRWQETVKAIASAMAKYKGAASPIARKAGPDHTRELTIYPLGDPHIGLLAWRKETGDDHDLRIAERDLIAVVDTLVERAPPSHHAMLAQVGDFFHADDSSQLTPHGKNKLDVDSRHGKVAEIGFSIMRRLIDRLLQKHAQVHVVNAPGNHDPAMSLMLSMWLQAVYEREPRVKIQDSNNPFSYRKFGKNLIGVVHGDGAKIPDLAAIMASDVPGLWGKTDHRLWITGHIHHRTVTEVRGCTIESFRTLAPKDFWHHWKGYRSKQSLCAITLDSEYGEVGRCTVDIKLGRDRSPQKS